MRRIAADSRFNPLHCGAVVASDVALAVATAAVCFNPLHCGAVVASPARRKAGGQQGGKVSIPFIAGQWSLRSARGGKRSAGPVSIPFIAGQWSLRGGARRDHGYDQVVSIPFIAGQWSLRLCYGSGLPRVGKFQSPSLRGSGRFQGGKQNKWDHSCSFQSPSLRGSGRFRRFIWLDNFGSRAFQSPSLRGSGRFTFHTRCFK